MCKDVLAACYMGDQTKEDVVVTLFAKRSSVKQEDLQSCLKKASKSVWTLTVVVYPDILSPTP